MKEQSIKLLLIEDNPGDTSIIRKMLSDSDELFDIDCAKQLSSGLERLSQNDYDVILLDLGLPDSQGIHTFEAINEKAKRLPVIIMTGLSDRDIGLETVSMGAQDYLVKGEITGDLLVRSLRYGIERKRAEIALKENETLLKNLITIGSHELRHPLTLLKSYSTILLESRGDIDADDVRQALIGIDKAVDRMTRFMNQSLEISRIVSGQQILNYEDVSCRSLVLEVVEEFLSMGKQTVEFTDKFTEDVNVKADWGSLRSVLFSLVDNAVKFSPGNSRVDIWYEESGTDIIFRVADLGPGIPAEYQDSIFKLYFQVVNVEHHSLPGMGAGLHIAKIIVEMHGGRIWEEPRDGGGSVFSFSIPRLVRERASSGSDILLQILDEEG